LHAQTIFFRDRALARFSLRVNAQTNSNERLKLATSSKKKVVNSLILEHSKFCLGLYFAFAYGLGFAGGLERGDLLI